MGPEPHNADYRASEQSTGPLQQDKQELDVKGDFLFVRLEELR